jgi:integrase
MRSGPLRPTATDLGRDDGPVLHVHVQPVRSAVEGDGEVEAFPAPPCARSSRSTPQRPSPTPRTDPGSHAPLTQVFAPVRSSGNLPVLSRGLRYGGSTSTVSRRTSVVAGFYRTCLIDGILDHSPAEHLRRPTVPPECPTLGLTHLQFEAMLTAARLSPSDNDFALVAMVGMLGLRIFQARCRHHRPARATRPSRPARRGQGTRVVLVPLPPAVARAIDRAVAGRGCGPILRSRRGSRMDRHAATRRLRRLAEDRRRASAADAPC